jgi:hypothetical protein
LESRKKAINSAVPADQPERINFFIDLFIDFYEKGYMAVFKKRWPHYIYTKGVSIYFLLCQGHYKPQTIVKK